MDYWEEKYNDLVWRYGDRGSMIDKLNTKVSMLESKLDSAEYKINTELEPRIKQENDSYDTYVTSPSYGMPEGCRQDCLACKNMECDGYRDYLTDQGYNLTILEELAGIPWFITSGIKNVNDLNKEIKDFNKTLKNFMNLDDIPFTDISRPLMRGDIVDGVLCVNSKCSKARGLNITGRKPWLKLWYKLYDFYLIKTCRVIKDDYVEMLNDM